MARVLMIIVALLWLATAVRLVRAHRRSRPDHRLRVALEALGRFKPI